MEDKYSWEGIRLGDSATRASLTHQTHHNVAFGRVQRATREGFYRPEASEHNWPDAPQRPIILARFSAPLGADVTPTGRTRPVTYRTRRCTPCLCTRDELTEHDPSIRSAHHRVRLLRKYRPPPLHAGERERGSQTYLYRLNSTFFANVLTSLSVHHHVHVC
jgi:hypothetical protein